MDLEHRMLVFDTIQRCKEMSKRGTVKTTIKLARSDAERVKELARALGASASDIIRAALLLAVEGRLELGEGRLEGASEAVSVAVPVELHEAVEYRINAGRLSDFARAAIKALLEERFAGEEATEPVEMEDEEGYRFIVPALRGGALERS